MALNPIGGDGPYNSLNVGVGEPATIIGTDVDRDAVFMKSTWAGNYCDGGMIGTFRYDGGCWFDQPAPFGDMVPNVRFEMMEPACTDACYVSPAGNDNWSGTLNQPKKTIQAAITQVSPGGTVHVADGHVCGASLHR